MVVTSSDTVDILVVGGGVNGAGIARDAAGRGLRVTLCEKGDLAEGTSSRSSKLIHGGLRYLAYGEFRLVREALGEREVLLRAAPHIVWPMRFVIPHSREQRPAWMIRLGLLLYDRLGGPSSLPTAAGIDLRHGAEGAPVRPAFRRGFAYSDCWVDDARLVVLNAMDAAARGATILLHTEVTSARRSGGQWRVTLRGEAGEQEVGARILVNAAGPWVDQVAGRVAGHSAPPQLRLVQGSHLIVRRFYDGPHAYLLQNDDRRVVFVIPYQGDLCLIGTTDVPFDGDPAGVAVSAGERSYLLRAVNRYMAATLSEADIVAEYAGIRPLHDSGNAANASAITRDYSFDVSAPDGTAPLLSVYGGKITTYRKLAEHALDKLSAWLPPHPAWTATAPLPGGDVPGGDFARFTAELGQSHPRIPPALLQHYARLYGTRTRALLAGAATVADLGQHFGGLLYECEALFLRGTEWAKTPGDVLERRTKHGLHLTAEQIVAFGKWWSEGGVPAPHPETVMHVRPTGFGRIGGQ